MNAFQAGSNADISIQNIDVNTGMLPKQNSKQNFTKNNSFMTGSEEIYGTQTSGISGSIGQASGKMNLTGSAFYQPPLEENSRDSNTRNRESGTMGTSPNVPKEQHHEQNVRNIDEEIPISLNAGMIGGHPNNFDDLPTNHLNQPSEGASRRPQTSHGRGRKSKQSNLPGSIKKREEKTQGLGETSKGGWAGFDNEEEEVQQQYVQPEPSRQVQQSRPKTSIPKKKFTQPDNDLDDLDDFGMGGGGNTNQNDDVDDFFGGDNNEEEEYIMQNRGKK